MEGKRRLAAGAFLLGLACGLVMVGTTVWNSLRAVQERGIQIEVETAAVAAQVRAEVQRAVRREVPATLEAVRRDVPQRVAAETARRLSTTMMEIGGFKVAVPPAAVEQVRDGVEEALRAGMDAAVSQADVNGLAGRLGDQAFALVSARLDELIGGQRFEVQVLPWFSVPVTIVAR